MVLFISYNEDLFLIYNTKNINARNTKNVGEHTFCTIASETSKENTLIIIKLRAFTCIFYYRKVTNLLSQYKFLKDDFMVYFMVCKLHDLILAYLHVDGCKLQICIFGIISGLPQMSQASCSFDWS